MVNVKAIALLLLVLPAIILAASSTCRVAVSSKVQSSSGSYTTYTATATNNGDATVGNIILTPSKTLKSLEGLTASTKNAYTISTLAAKSSKTFSYRAKSAVTWTTTCTGTTTTTKAPAPTTKAPTPTTKTPTQTTKAPTPTPKPSTTTGSAPSAPTGGRICPAGSWWAPAPLTTWQWQLTGTIDTSKNVQMYDIDLFDATSTLISTLHSKGRVVICYFSTQFEDWRPDAKSFTSAVKGGALDGWEGENYVDIRSTVVRNIMKARMDLAVSKGCDGIEPDNVDGYTAKDNGFKLTAADQAAYNTFLANEAHARGLSIGLKNDLDQVVQLQPVFDWALNEQCHEYGECSMLTPFVTAGKAVFNTEYSGSSATVCPAMNKLKFSALVKNLDLDASIKAQCCTTLNNCAAAPYTCKTASSPRNVRSVDGEAVAENIEIAQEFTASASTTYASMLVVAVVFAALNF